MECEYKTFRQAVSLSLVNQFVCISRVVATDLGAHEYYVVADIRPDCIRGHFSMC